MMALLATVPEKVYKYLRAVASIVTGKKAKPIQVPAKDLLIDGKINTASDVDILSCPASEMPVDLPILANKKASVIFSLASMFSALKTAFTGHMARVVSVSSAVITAIMVQLVGKKAAPTQGTAYEMNPSDEVLKVGMKADVTQGKAIDIDTGHHMILVRRLSALQGYIRGDLRYTETMMLRLASRMVSAVGSVCSVLKTMTIERVADMISASAVIASVCRVMGIGIGAGMVGSNASEITIGETIDSDSDADLSRVFPSSVSSDGVQMSDSTAVAFGADASEIAYQKEVPLAVRRRLDVWGYSVIDGIIYIRRAYTATQKDDVLLIGSDTSKWIDPVFEDGVLTISQARIIKTNEESLGVI